MISPSEKVQTLERGNIYFIYQPRVEQEQVESARDVQRLYMVLAPHGKQVYRLAVLGRKKLPEPEREGRQRYWGFIDAVEKDAQRIEDEFDPETYKTKTRGEREVPPARPAGEGIYRIVRHEDHTHLIYALELPGKPGKVQDELNIESEASYIIQIKNPQRGAPQAPGLDEDRQAEYPKKLQDRFEDRKFYDADPPDFLDYAGTEFLLISAAEDVKEELGIDLDPQKETEDTAEIFNDLRMERSEHPTKPLLKGEWE
ncbi:MAG: hypothetical protein ACODAQ_03605 [Phycisphaeraceae bacterium]